MRPISKDRTIESFEHAEAMEVEQIKQVPGKKWEEIFGKRDWSLSSVGVREGLAFTSSSASLPSCRPFSSELIARGEWATLMATSSC
jgi:hypothetical protein